MSLFTRLRELASTEETDVQLRRRIKARAGYMQLDHIIAERFSKRRDGSSDTGWIVRDTNDPHMYTDYLYNRESAIRNMIAMYQDTVSKYR